MNQIAPGNESSRIKEQNITFTNKLAAAVLRQVGRGESSIAFAEILSDLIKEAHAEQCPITWQSRDCTNDTYHIYTLLAYPSPLALCHPLFSPPLLTTTLQ